MLSPDAPRAATALPFLITSQPPVLSPRFLREKNRASPVCDEDTANQPETANVSPTSRAAAASTDRYVLSAHCLPLPTGPAPAMERFSAFVPAGVAASEWPDESATVPLASDMCQTPT